MQVCLDILWRKPNKLTSWNNHGRTQKEGVKYARRNEEAQRNTFKFNVIGSNAGSRWYNWSLQTLVSQSLSQHLMVRLVCTRWSMGWGVVERRDSLVIRCKKCSCVHFGMNCPERKTFRKMEIMTRMFDWESRKSKCSNLEPHSQIVY